MSDEALEESLWGELPVDVRMETPLGILRSQAKALNKASGGLLDGRIVQFDASGGRFGYELQIVVPALSNYSIAVVSVLQPLTLYPAVVYADLDKTETQATNAEEVKTQLKAVLQGTKVREIVKALISQANEAGNTTSRQQRKSLAE